MIFWRKTFPQNMIIWHVRKFSIGNLTEFEKLAQDVARLNVLVQNVPLLKKFFKIWSFSKDLIQKFFLFQNFFSQNNAFQESMEKPKLTFSRWKLTEKTDFSTAIFQLKLDRLEKIFNSKQNVFPQRYLSQNQFFRKSLKILSFYSFYDKKQPQKKILEGVFSN